MKLGRCERTGLVEDRGSFAVKENLVQQAQKYLLANPRFFDGGANALWRKHEAIVTGVRQLDSVGPLGAAYSVHVIDADAGGGVQDSTARPKSVCRSVRRVCCDLLAHQRCSARPSAQLRGIEILIMTERAQYKLTVAVPVNVQLDALLITEVAEEVVHRSVLWRITRALTAIGLRAFVLGGAAGVGIPVVFPVSVDVATIAGLVGSSCWRWLAVLAPQSVRCLGVYETLTCQRILMIKSCCTYRQG